MDPEAPPARPTEEIWIEPLLALIQEGDPNAKVSLKEMFKMLKDKYLQLKPSEDEELAALYAADIFLTIYGHPLRAPHVKGNDVGSLTQAVHDFSKEWDECVMEHKVYMLQARESQLSDIERSTFHTVHWAHRGACNLVEMVSNARQSTQASPEATSILMGIPSHLSIRKSFRMVRHAQLQGHPSGGEGAACVIAAASSITLGLARFRQNDLLMQTIYNTLKEWKECVDEHRVIEMLPQASEHIEGFETMRSLIRMSYAAASLLIHFVGELRGYGGPGQLTAASLGEGSSSGVITSDQLPSRKSGLGEPEEQTNDNEEDEAKAKDKKKKKKKKKKSKPGMIHSVTESSHFTEEYALANLLQLPIASELHEGDALPEGLGDTGLELKEGFQNEAGVIATCIPPTPLEAELHDPDGHTVWCTKPESKRRYFKNKDWPKPILKFPVKYVVKEAEDGTGMGVFATEDIKRFEPVLIERPYLVIPTTSAHLFSDISREASQKLTQAQLLQLQLKGAETTITSIFDRLMRPEAREGFMSLANSHKHDGSGPIFGIIRTNAFRVEFEKALPGLDRDYGWGYTAVGNIASRFNHRFDPVTFSLRFAAARDIKAGSQICISYTDMFLPKAERQEKLLRYDFQCACHGCANATPESERLRATCRKMIEDWKKQAVSDWLKRPNLREGVLKPLLETKKQMEKDRLDYYEAAYFQLVLVISEVYKKVGNEKKAKTFMDLFQDMKSSLSWMSSANSLYL
ncbi:hypothetical protein MD484_g2459, partial [Candolleomyces efflorescens]